MSDPFIAEIKIVSFNFPPKGWALCNGQILPINQNQALFSLIGTTYGGNGQTTFALPNLQGRTPVHPGNLISLGQQAGEENHTLLGAEMPAHNHTAFGANVAGDGPAPTGGLLAAEPSQLYAPPNANLVALASGTISQAGGSQPHNNLMPYLTLNFCIALVGIFPSRS
jgi:microcystin-dependent protein